RAIKLIHMVASNGYEIFYLTRPALDTMRKDTWYHIEFQYTPYLVEGVDNRFVIRYQNPFFNRGKLYLKHLEVTLIKEKPTQNLIRNPSFEWYYYFPVAFGKLMAGSMQYWNDFNLNYDLLNPNLVVTHNSDAYVF